MKKVIRNHARVAGYLSDDFEDLGYQPIKVDHALYIRGFCKDLKRRLEVRYRGGGRSTATAMRRYQS